MCFTASNIRGEKTNQSSLHFQSQHFLLYIKSLNNRIFCNPTENVIKLKAEKKYPFHLCFGFSHIFLLECLDEWPTKKWGSSKKGCYFTYHI